MQPVDRRDDPSSAASTRSAPDVGFREPTLQRLESDLPGWLAPHGGDNRIPVAIAIVAAAALQFLLPTRFILLPVGWLLPALEMLLLGVLVVLNPLRLSREAAMGRFLSLLLVALISLDNGASAGLLDTKLIAGTAGDQAGPLLASAAAIYLTNVIAFGIWYWELDRGGPFSRAAGKRPYPDFLFPQMGDISFALPNWRPYFFDYLYVSFTNATAFSPTDTMPLTRKVKALMTLQSLIALSTTALVIARAVNILK